MAPSRRKGVSKAAAAAAARRQWKVGDLVLAKVKGFPAWPAKVGEPESLGFAADWKKVVVHFFGTKPEQIGFCNPADVEAFTEEKKQSLLVKRQGRSADFLRAVQEIIDSFEKLKQQDQDNDLNSGAEVTQTSVGNSVDLLAKSNDQTEAPEAMLSSELKNSYSPMDKKEPSLPVEDTSVLLDREALREESTDTEVVTETPLPSINSSRKRSSLSQPQSCVTHRKSQRSRCSSRLESRRSRSLVMPCNDTGKNAGGASGNVISDSSLRRNRRVRKSPDVSELDDVDFSAFVSNGSIEENSSEVVTVDSDTFSLNEGSTIESGCKVEHSDTIVECFDGDVELGKGLDLQIKAVFIKKKRKPNRKRVTNDAAVPPATLDKEISLEVEVQNNSLNSQSGCEEMKERCLKEDGDEHLPLVKRARVRMGKSSSVEEELKSCSPTEEITKTEVTVHPSEQMSMLECENNDLADRDLLGINGAHDNVSSPTKYCTEVSAKRSQPWKERKEQSFGCSVDGEAALPPSKRLHRALEAMSANAAEEGQACNEASHTLTSGVSGSSVSSMNESPHMAVESKAGNGVCLLGMDSMGNISSQVGCSGFSTCLNPIIAEENTKSSLEVEFCSQPVDNFETQSHECPKDVFPDAMDHGDGVDRHDSFGCRDVRTAIPTQSQGYSSPNLDERQANPGSSETSLDPLSPPKAEGDTENIELNLCEARISDREADACKATISDREADASRNTGMSSGPVPCSNEILKASPRNDTIVLQCSVEGAGFEENKCLKPQMNGRSNVNCMCAPHFISFPRPTVRRPTSHSRFSASLAMDDSKAGPTKEMPLGLDAAMEEEYTSQSKLLQEFSSISNIDKAWIFKSDGGIGAQAMFSISQANLLANKKRKFVLSAHISKESNNSVSFRWAPFPTEMTGASTIVPSPSGSKLLVVRNPENESPCKLEIWSPSQLEKEFHIPQAVHGPVYTDGWFEGVSWNSDETLIAYVAEEPSPSKPTFNDLGFKKGGSTDKDCGSWKGQGDWEEDWGETYAGKRQPALFVINTASGEIQAVRGIDKSLSIGQVVWAPSSKGMHQYLVFVGWSSGRRKLGIKYCYNRPCALYTIRAPLWESGIDGLKVKDSLTEDGSMLNLTQHISSAFFPRFSPDGKFLMFLSAKSSVDSGAHSATDSLHRIDWPTDIKLWPSAEIVDVIPVIMCATDGCFPGLYCSSFLSNPWLSDGRTMIISSTWGSSQVVLSVNVLSGKVLRISPADSKFSWNVLTLDGDNLLAVSSSPVDVPQIKYGCIVEKAPKADSWSWLNVSSPIFKCSEKVKSLLSSQQFSIMKIPVRDVSDSLTKGARKPFEAIFVSSNCNESDSCNPLIVILHGGPHSVSISSFSKSLAFLSSIGYNLLIVNYRGSLGFGEEALQSLPGKVGSQDVNDVLTAIDHVIDKGLASPSKLTVLGGSHGGFLTAHLIGQAPDKFVAAAVRNPVCNLALMVGTTDIPDWCYVEACGSKDSFTEAPPAEDLTLFYNRSPISHLKKVKTPTLFLLGAQDLRVPVSNGLQYARVLREKGVEVKLIVFPNDAHGIERPQSDFESFLNIGVWFRKYCK